MRVRKGYIGSGNPGHLVMRSQNKTGAIVYIIAPDKVTIDMTKLAGAEKAKATWFDPRTGKRRPAGPLR
jgi:hypothetical protein